MNGFVRFNSMVLDYNCLYFKSLIFTTRVGGMYIPDIDKVNIALIETL